MAAVCFLRSCSVSLAFSSGTILRRSSEKPPIASSAVSCNSAAGHATVCKVKINSSVTKQTPTMDDHDTCPNVAGGAEAVQTDVQNQVTEKQRASGRTSSS